jgi:hypothetical protein
MKTYVFSGRVIPERDALTISNPVPFKLSIPGTKSPLNGTANIQSSQISVTISDPEGVDIYTLKNYVQDGIRVLVDSFGYLIGGGFDIEFDHAVDNEGNQTVFRVVMKELFESRNERPFSQENLAAFFILVSNSPQLCMALSNLRESIRSPSDTGFHCFRAIESLRQHFVTKEDKEKIDSWRRMNLTLRLDESWTKKLDTMSFTDLSQAQRHGEGRAMTWPERLSAMQRAWKVVDRFCTYLKNGNKPLDASFPILK